MVRIAVLALLLGLSACSTPPAPSAAAPLLPEIASGVQAKPGWTHQRLAVAAANPLAAEAGLKMLRAGGSAMDAAVAVQMVLTLVEPQSSGIGGGAFLMHWDGRSVSAWDGRETAPAAADERLFMQADGKPMPFMQAVAGGRSVGVPGAVRMLEAAHRQHGRLPWAQLFQPAILLAEQGFAVGHRLHTQAAAFPAVKRDRQAAAYFFGPDGQAWPAGHRLKNPALAQVLRRIAAEGSAALHHGVVAEDIVRRVRGDARNPGLMSLADLAGYQPLQREAICTLWLQVWRVCGFPPPSSGHLAVMQILGLLERSPAVPMLQDGLPGPDFLHPYAEASRLAFADRAAYVADPDFVAAPGGRWDSLLGDAYLGQRAALIGPERSDKVAPGQPGGRTQAWAPQAEQPEHGTSHISIVDSQGHALAMTTTIEFVFGAQIMSDGGTGLPGGFLLNNELTDFALNPADAQGRPVANRLQPGKRPRSSMSPTLVFDARVPGPAPLVMSLGSPGGAAIIHFVAKTLLGTLQAGLDPQRAIDLPNFAALGTPLLLEQGRFPDATVRALTARGHSVHATDLTSGLQALQRRPAALGGGWSGGADPRREGVVLGD